MTTRKLSRTAKVRRYLASPAGAKLTHATPALAVFGVAAYQSYWHIVEVALRADSSGQHTETAYILPISIDGLMLTAGRYVTHAKSRLGKVLAFFFFAIAVVATLAANVTAADPNILSQAVAVWPAVALVGTAVVLHWGERKAKSPSRVRTPKQATLAEPKPLHSVA